MNDNILFASGTLRDWLEEARLRQALAAVEAIPPDEVLARPESDFVQELVSRYRVNPPRLHLAKRYTPGAQDVKVDVSQDPFRAILDRSRPFYVPGTRVEIRVPFDGDPELFRLRPSSFTTIFPRGRVEGQELVIWHEAPTDTLNAEQFKSQLEDQLQSIQRYLEWVVQDCSSFNEELERAVQQAVQRRKQKILQDRNLEAFLKIPIQRRPDASPVFSVPVERRRQIIQAAREQRPTVTEPFVPEPAISPEDYAEILDVIRSYRDLIERFPRTFGGMPEESLRDILVVVLNNQFGPTGAEVFSRQGKTDIFLWHEKGAVFIAECKFWEGPKAFKEALDQLLGYLVWRDTKAALILFVREQNVTAVVQKAYTVAKDHSRYKRCEADVATFPIYVFHQEGDRDREIKIALVVVAVPKEDWNE